MKSSDLSSSDVLSMSKKVTTLEMKELNERQRADHAVGYLCLSRTWLVSYLLCTRPVGHSAQSIDVSENVSVVPITRIHVHTMLTHAEAQRPNGPRCQSNIALSVEFCILCAIQVS